MGQKKTFSKGALIIREGSYQRDAYIIEKGRVEVSRKNEKGNKTVIAIRGKNEIIGEMTLLDGGTRCATVTALDDCEVSILKYESFKVLPGSNSGVKALRKVMNDRKKAATFPQHSPSLNQSGEGWGFFSEKTLIFFQVQAIDTHYPLNTNILMELC